MWGVIGKWVEFEFFVCSVFIYVWFFIVRMELVVGRNVDGLWVGVRVIFFSIIKFWYGIFMSSRILKILVFYVIFINVYFVR